MIDSVPIPTSTLLLPWYAGVIAWIAIALLLVRRWRAEIIHSDGFVLQFCLCAVGLCYWLVAIDVIGPLPWEVRLRTAFTVASILAFGIELAAFTWPIYRRTHRTAVL
ncbi:hypothetical protein [Halocatena halophila]|uniref:hypothetical protein n=1 Tax=Halocatena halophila TaxID=2814576 RepID=UPI002ED4196D